MIYLLNTWPAYCPQCARPQAAPSPLGHNDFIAGATHKCSCGVLYQFVPTTELITAATTAGGDLAEYAR